MYTRHNEVPVYETRKSEIDAHSYNLVRLALTRLDSNLRFSLPGLKHLDLILQPDAWIVVDHVLNDVPVVAWTDFASKSRKGLHLPVACRIRLYHANAGMILKSVITSMDAILNDRLHPQTQMQQTAFLSSEPS